jgi:glycosyltransferase involved in cell wall biosynthesis
MACAVPVIAFNVAGYRETIKDNETGYLVDFDAQQIADKIQYLMDNDKITLQMGVHGRDWVLKNWTWTTQIDKLENILQSLLK